MVVESSAVSDDPDSQSAWKQAKRPLPRRFCFLYLHFEFPYNIQMISTLRKVTPQVLDEIQDEMRERWGGTHRARLTEDFCIQKTQ